MAEESKSDLTKVEERDSIGLPTRDKTELKNYDSLRALVLSRWDGFNKLKEEIFKMFLLAENGSKDRDILFNMIYRFENRGAGSCNPRFLKTPKEKALFKRLKNTSKLKIHSRKLVSNL